VGDGPIALGTAKVAVLSTESILGAVAPTNESVSVCAACGTPLAADQRYCLECGERRASVSEFLRSGPPRAAAPPAAPPGSRPPELAGEPQPPRSNALSLLAGIGVLLLAMGVGVLIGRSGGGTTKSAPAEVVTVAGTGTAAGSGSEEAFSDDWPSGTKGYTVQLQTLPAEGTTVAAVNQAKSAATGKGAGSVGALKSEHFASLTSGSYLIYSGVYHKRSEAQKALGSLKKSFPGAKVVEVSEKEAKTSTGGAGSTKGSGGSGSDINHPAPPSVLEGESHSKGKSFEEKSKNLPNVVSTG
jgi:hypothetical protein